MRRADRVTLIVRAATVVDAAVVHTTVLAAWEATVDPRSSGHRLTVDEVAALLSTGGGFVAEADGQVVGSVLWAVEDGCVELMKLAVLPPARGTGVGPALVEAVVDVARGQGVAQVLLAVSRYSPQLVSWYARLGFAESPNAVYAHAAPTSPPPTVMVRAADCPPEKPNDPCR